MRRQLMDTLAPVLITGFAGLSCLTNLWAQSPAAGLPYPDTYSGIPVQQASCMDGTSQGRGRGELAEVCDGYMGPFFYFQTDYLIWNRNSNLQSGPIIGGPDTFSYNDLGFGYDSGYRLRGAAAFQMFELEFTWAEIDGWNDSRAGQLTTGVGFDTGAAFAGANFVNNTTFFSSIFNAASLNAGGIDETSEDEGLGPVGAFADPAPTFLTEYRSNLSDFELMAKYAPFNSRIKLGLGWRSVSLDELARTSVTGTFRAIDNGGGANGGLSHDALTSPLGGNLQLISGAADGFDDETGLLGGAGPDQLQMLHRTDTDNSLNGVQFGLEALLVEGEWFLLDGFLKAGVYQNQASGSVSETYTGLVNDNSVYGRVLADETNSVAFVGQIGLGATYRVNEWLRLRAGWEVLFISGVALAPDQLANGQAGTFQLNNDGDMIANGGHLGLEFTF